jgi:hypothetical protein
MMLARTTAILLLTSTFLALPVGAVPPGCADNTVANAMPIDRYYMVGTASQFWEETNDVAGLQRTQISCPGPDIPADTCIAHSENNALLACLTTYPSSLG